MNYLLKQHLYRSLALKFSGEINLEENVSEDDQLINPIIDLSWNRRAYNLSLFYNFDKEMGGFKFDIFSFNFKGSGENFKITIIQLLLFLKN